MSGDGFEHRAEPIVGLRGTAGHDRGPEQGPLLPAGHAHAHEMDAGILQNRLSTLSVFVEGVAGVDDDVSGPEEFTELVDDRLGSGARLDHDDDDARAPQ